MAAHVRAVALAVSQVRRVSAREDPELARVAARAASRGEHAQHDAAEDAGSHRAGAQPAGPDRVDEKDQFLKRFLRCLRVWP